MTTTTFQRQVTTTFHIKDNVAYRFSRAARKWSFKANVYGKRYELLTSVNGGLEVAHTIAVLVRQGMVRTRGRGLDDIAREELAKINHA